MNAIRVKIAGIVFEIRTEYRPADSLYKDFRTKEAAQYRIMLTDEDIDDSCVRNNAVAKLFIDTSCIMRKFSDALLEFDTLLIHGVAIGVRDSAYVFTAPSRTGKTTHARMWQASCTDSYIINGDKPFLKFAEDGNVLACGSPWAGKENLYINTMVPLKAIVFMERAEENHIECISFGQAFPFLLQQVYRPNDIDKMRKTLRLMQRLSQTVTFWRFKCNNFKNDCFDVAFNALVRNQK